jgi:hypothetical protein
VKRVVLSRRAGYRMPPGCISVANGSRFRNPFRPLERSAVANAAAVALYRDWLLAQPALVEDAKRSLTGHDLACVCPLDLPCHVDVLIEICS